MGLPNRRVRSYSATWKAGLWVAFSTALIFLLVKCAVQLSTQERFSARILAEGGRERQKEQQRPLLQLDSDEDESPCVESTELRRRQEFGARCSLKEGGDTVFIHIKVVESPIKKQSLLGELGEMLRYFVGGKQEHKFARDTACVLEEMIQAVLREAEETGSGRITQKAEQMILFSGGCPQCSPRPYAIAILGTYFIPCCMPAAAPIRGSVRFEVFATKPRTSGTKEDEWLR
ncbi:hypothetical protein, conserved [Eimeria brunetti]|uniref:Uncharacterized protein n=1 Tax=Eimeria brunetti TaxID=51314 RepID=U6LSK6_9EIME|nr:hypothetical protein, conserved [Eimeria brunetti]